MVRRLALGRALREALAFPLRAWRFTPGACAAVAVAFVGGAWLAQDCLPYGLAIRPALAAAVFLLSVSGVGGLLRLAASQDIKAARANGLGPLGLQFGPGEIRLMLSGLLTCLFLAAVAASVLMVLWFVSNALGAAIDADASRLAPWRASALTAARAIALWTLVQLALRLSLAKPATLAEGRIVATDSLALVSGSAWRLAAGQAAAWAPATLLAWLAVRGSWPAVFDTLPSPWRLPILAAAFGFIAFPLATGFLGAAYRDLRMQSGMS